MGPKNRDSSLCERRIALHESLRNGIISAYQKIFEGDAQ
jgi:hypothetical protein